MKITKEYTFQCIISYEAENKEEAFPCGGVLVGVHDSETNKPMFWEIDVKYFQEPLFSVKAYLEKKPYSSGQVRLAIL